MIYCTTFLKLLVGSSVETYSLDALEAVVNRRECAIFAGLRDANVGSQNLKIPFNTFPIDIFDLKINQQNIFIYVNCFCWNRLKIYHLKVFKSCIIKKLTNWTSELSWSACLSV